MSHDLRYYGFSSSFPFYQFCLLSFWWNFAAIQPYEAQPVVSIALGCCYARWQLTSDDVIKRTLAYLSVLSNHCTTITCLSMWLVIAVNRLTDIIIISSSSSSSRSSSSTWRRSSSAALSSFIAPAGADYARCYRPSGPHFPPVQVCATTANPIRCQPQIHLKSVDESQSADAQHTRMT